MIDHEDVDRTIHAAVLSKLVEEAWPVVAGEDITKDARAAASTAGVWIVLNARTTPPAVGGELVAEVGRVAATSAPRTLGGWPSVLDIRPRSAAENVRSAPGTFVLRRIFPIR